MSIQFIRPSIEYKDSYLQALAEFDSAGEALPPIFRTIRPIATTDFDLYVERLLGFETGKTIEGRFANHIIYWIVEAGEYIGHISLRPQLNEKLLLSGGNVGMYIRPSRRGQGIGSIGMQFIAKEAVAKGLHKLLYTCNQDNIASQKMIEKAGGQLQDVIEYKGKQKCRYWVTV